MTNVFEITSESIKKAQARRDETVRKADELLRKTESALRLLHDLSGPLSRCLSEMGLEIAELSYCKTGMDSTVWNDGDSLNVSLSLRPVSGKFKFMTFRGYDARGRGKNDSRLQEKATAMQEKIQNTMGFPASVNSCSLELRDGQITKTVLANIWIRP